MMSGPSKVQAFYYISGNQFRAIGFRESAKNIIANIVIYPGIPWHTLTILGPKTHFSTPLARFLETVQPTIGGKTDG